MGYKPTKVVIEVNNTARKRLVQASITAVSTGTPSSRKALNRETNNKLSLTTTPQSSMQSLFILALLSIFALLAIPLKSYVQPLIIMTAIPFGIVGAIIGHWSNGLMISLLSLNGILALSGVVVNDSLLLVSRFNALREVLILAR